MIFPETISHVKGSLDNSETNHLTPLIHIWLEVVNKTVTTPAIALQNASFIATFNNEEIKGKGHEDSNTVLNFAPLQAVMEGLPLRSDSIVIRNLLHPRANLHLHSDYKLSDINGLVDKNSLLFQAGAGKLDFRYTGSLEGGYDSSRSFSGIFQLDSASIKYVPRNLVFNKGKGMVRFERKDILIDSLYLTTGATDLLLNGQIKNVFYLISQKNKKLSLDCVVRSNKLNLNDFLNYLQPKSTRKTEAQKKSELVRTIAQFSGILDTADFNIDLRAKALQYKKFYGNNLVAKLQLTNNAVSLNDISLSHAQGTVKMKGILRNLPASNPFSIQAQLKNIDISKIFYAFNNFGLRSLTDKNIRGNLSADINLQGLLKKLRWSRMI